MVDDERHRIDFARSLYSVINESTNVKCVFAEDLIEPFMKMLQ